MEVGVGQAILAAGADDAELCDAGGNEQLESERRRGRCHELRAVVAGQRGDDATKPSQMAIVATSAVSRTSGHLVGRLCVRGARPERVHTAQAQVCTRAAEWRRARARAEGG